MASGTQVASLYGLVDVEDKATSKLKGVGGALKGLATQFAAFGVAGFLVGAVKEASQAQSAIAQLDAVLKSTGGTMAQTAKQAGHYATVTKAVGANVDEWQKGLKSATASLGRLQAKQAAGIGLTAAEQKNIGALQGQIQGYSAALAGATTSQKVWIDGAIETNAVTHMARQAYLDLASSLQRVTRYDDEAILSAENVLLTFRHIGADVFPDATEAVLDLSTAMGQDLKASAIQIGKALEDPISGVTALRRVGVMLTDVQEKQIRQFVRMNQLDKARAVILKELKTEFGGSARAAGDTFAGALDILNHSIDDLMEGIGNALIPTLQSLAGFLTDLVTSIGTVDPTLVQLAALFTGIVIAAGPIGAILGAVLSPLGAIALAVGGLALAWTNDWGGIRTTISDAFAEIQPILADLVKGVQHFFEVLSGPKVPDLSQTVGAALQGALDRMPDIRIDTGKKLKLSDLPPGTGKEMLDAFTAPFKDFGAAAMEKAKFDALPFGTRISAALDAAWPEIEAALGRLADKILPSFGKLVTDNLRLLPESVISDADIDTVSKQIGDAAAEWLNALLNPFKGLANSIRDQLLNIPKAYGIVMNEVAKAMETSPVLAGLAGVDPAKLRAEVDKFNKSIVDMMNEKPVEVPVTIAPPTLAPGAPSAAPVPVQIAPTLTPEGVTKAVTDNAVQISNFGVQIGSGVRAGMIQGLDVQSALQMAVGLADAWASKEGKTAFGLIGSGVATALSGKFSPISGKVIGALATGLLGLADMLLKLGGFPFLGPTALAIAAGLKAAASRDIGGPGKAGQPYLIGAGAQPELFVPGSSGSFYPRGSYGGNVSVTLIANGVNDPVQLVNKVDWELRRRGIKPIGSVRGAS